MSSSKSTFDLPTDVPSDSPIPPPSYDSIYDPPPTTNTTDTKPAPLTSLADLRTRISANRSSASDPAAILQRRLVSHMADRTSAFLESYSTTPLKRARLSFCACDHVAPSSTEVLTGTAADAAAEEYTEFEVLGEKHFWDDRQAAWGLAGGLRRVLDERMGGFEKMRTEGVDVSIREEEATWRKENVFGVWETGTGWGIVLRIKVDV